MDELLSCVDVAFADKLLGSVTTCLRFKPFLHSLTTLSKPARHLKRWCFWAPPSRKFGFAAAPRANGRRLSNTSKPTPPAKHAVKPSDAVGEPQPDAMDTQLAQRAAWQGQHGDWTYNRFGIDHRTGRKITFVGQDNAEALRAQEAEACRTQCWKDPRNRFDNPTNRW